MSLKEEPPAVLVLENVNKNVDESEEKRPESILKPASLESEGTGYSSDAASDTEIKSLRKKKKRY